MPPRETLIPEFTVLVAGVASLIALGIEIYIVTIAYPVFGLIGSREFNAIHTLHAARITYSVGPALLVAFATNAVLVASRPGSVPVGLAVAATLAGAAVLAVTALVQVPLHARLGRGHDAAVVARLNANEWLRAVPTAIQAGCDVAMLWIALNIRA